MEGEQKYIVFIEDDPNILEGTKLCFEGYLPGHKFVLSEGGNSCIEDILQDTVGVEGIGILFTDGDVKDGNKGWDITRELREKGYEGPAVYMGTTNLPSDQRDLYTDVIDGKAYSKHLKPIIEKYMPNP